MNFCRVLTIVLDKQLSFVLFLLVCIKEVSRKHILKNNLEKEKKSIQRPGDIRRFLAVYEPG